MSFTPKGLATFVLMLVAALGAAVESTAVERDIDYPLTLHLVWYDAYGLLPPMSFGILSREVGRIFGEAGVGVYWERDRSEYVDNVDMDPLRINVVLLPSSSSSWGLQDGVMGLATHRRGLKGGVYLFFPELMRVMNLDPEGVDFAAPKAIRNLGRAMGRIVAHELVHVFAPTHPHTSDGLMNGHLTRRFLTKSRVHIDDATTLVFRSRLEARANQILAASRVAEVAEEPTAAPAAPLSIYEFLRPR